MKSFGQIRPRRIALFKNELWVSSEMGSQVEIFDIETRDKLDSDIRSRLPQSK